MGRVAAGCQGTFGKAREVLERAILYHRSAFLFNSSVTATDSSLMVDYVNMLKRCKKYGERPATAAIPYVDSFSEAPPAGAQIVVLAVTDRWVECQERRRKSLAFNSVPLLYEGVPGRAVPAIQLGSPPLPAFSTCWP